MKIIGKLYSISFILRNNFYPIWNKIKFSNKGIIYGKNLKITSSMYLKLGINANITIGNDFTFLSNDCYNPLCRNLKGCLVANSNSQIHIGNNVGMSAPCIWSHESITIGNNVNIGGDCILLDSDAHSLNYLDRRIPFTDQTNKKNAPIIIEDDVLIGARCIILKGVTIGARTVIGSGSVVTKSIPADCIAAGNPCKVIRYFNENKS